MIPLRHMRALPGRPDEVRLFYSQSAGIVRFLMNEFGHERMDALLTEINEGRKIDDALNATYGFGVDELDTRWRRQSGRRNLDNRNREPGRAWHIRDYRRCAAGHHVGRHYSLAQATPSY